MTSLLTPWKLLISFCKQNLSAQSLSWGSLIPDLPRKLSGQGANCGCIHCASTAQIHTKDFNNGNCSKSTPWGAYMCFMDKQSLVGKSLAVKVQVTAGRWEEEQSELWQWLQFPLGAVSGFPGVTPSVGRLRRPQNNQHFAPVLPPLARLAGYGELK